MDGSIDAALFLSKLQMKYVSSKCLFDNFQKDYHLSLRKFSRKIGSKDYLWQNSTQLVAGFNLTSISLVEFFATVKSHLKINLPPHVLALSLLGL